MRKVLAVLCLTLVVAVTNANASNSYFVNEAAVEKVFKNSVASEVSFSLTEDLLMSQKSQLADNDPIVAILLDILVGGLGIHRVYLGGKTSLILIYFITCGGIFGIVPLVDFIVLVINYDDISAFVGNDKFIMW
ncbi:MAG: TM2 domain-containing membrane protein YozV [Marivirga sp.]|jgi:TM2 domain-containing membrane protein YozV